MQIIVYNKTTQDAEIFGNYPDKPVPRVGESIDMGYTPPAIVTQVVYSSKNNAIDILVK